LDSSTADQLFEQMGDHQASLVRQAVLSLGDVTVAEQEMILAEFFGQRPAPEHGEDSGVELHFSAPCNVSDTVTDSEAAPRFQFLSSTPGQVLALRLRGEHPQLIALVVSYLTPEKAAELMEHLPDALRNEVLSRLHELNDANPQIMADLEAALERLFRDSKAANSSSGKWHEHAQAILRHLRQKEEQRAKTPTSTQRETLVPPTPANVPMDQPISSSPTPRIAFEQMLSLSAADFFAVFGEADSRVVMLALAGAPRRIFERYLGQFSTERALEFERHLEQLRPLRLRDVEVAQLELATIAGHRLEAAKLAAESSRRFAAAA
jgi:flagellar motor switch protein FliG